ncbi:MAG: RibD family protein [Thioalkalivibrionaceae bacterium]
MTREFDMRLHEGQSPDSDACREQWLELLSRASRQPIRRKRPTDAHPNDDALSAAAARNRTKPDSRVHVIPRPSISSATGPSYVAVNAIADPINDPAAFEALYGPLLSPRPRCVAQLGQTLDGRVATENGHSFPVTGPEDHRHLHRLRALHDAVIVGVETVRLDDPRLTVRKVAGPNPVRVVLDPRARLCIEHYRVFQEDDAPTLWLVGQDERGPKTLPSHVERVVLPLTPLDQHAKAHDHPHDQTRHQSRDDTPEAVPEAAAYVEKAHTTATPQALRLGFSPTTILNELARRGAHRVLVEGGARTISHFLAEDSLHTLYLCVAPIVLGSGRSGLIRPPTTTMQGALRPKTEMFRLGDDLLYVLHLRDEPRPPAC